MEKTTKEEASKVEQLENQNLELQQNVAVLTDLMNLRDESYFRRQLLTMLEQILVAQKRIATAEEKTAKALTSSSEEQNSD